jgi:hypothetical protein
VGRSEYKRTPLGGLSDLRRGCWLWDLSSLPHTYHLALFSIPQHSEVCHVSLLFFEEPRIHRGFGEKIDYRVFA